MHCTVGILDLVLDDIIAYNYNYAFCNLIRALRLGSCDKEKVVQNTRPSFSHVWRGAGHETRRDILRGGRGRMKDILRQGREEKEEGCTEAKRRGGKREAFRM